MKVFLGGTCNDSCWRQEFIDMLEIDYFNPVVDNWDENAKQEELKQRKECDFILYVITPEMKGFYSIAEVVDDSNKRPLDTYFCYLEEYNGKVFGRKQHNSMREVMRLLERNSVATYDTLNDVAYDINKMAYVHTKTTEHIKRKEVKNE